MPIYWCVCVCVPQNMAYGSVNPIDFLLNPIISNVEVPKIFMASRDIPNSAHPTPKKTFGPGTQYLGCELSQYSLDRESQSGP